MILSVIIILAVGICIAASTYSYFSQTAQTAPSNIMTGNLYIGGTCGEKGVLDSLVNLQGLIPGDTPQNLDVKVKNLGTMPAYLTAMSVDINDDDNKFAANALKVICSDSSNDLLYSGSLLGLDQNPVPLEEAIPLKQGETMDLHLSVQLDIRATNWYKGKKVSFSLTVYAAQKPDQGLSGMVKLANRDNVQSIIDCAAPGDVILLAPGNYPNITDYGVSLKAEGVIFDTSIGGLDLENACGSAGTSNTSPLLVQGLSFNSAGSAPSLALNMSNAVTVSANIFNGSVNPILVSKAGQVTFTWNDVSACVKNGPFTLPVGVTGQGNLGLDLDVNQAAL
jgi:hypothetical protein